MKRELRALDAEVMQLEHRAAASHTELETLAAELRAGEQAQEELTAQQREAERTLFATKHRHEQSQSELARLGLDLTVCQGELARVPPRNRIRTAARGTGKAAARSSGKIAHRGGSGKCPAHRGSGAIARRRAGRARRTLCRKG